MQVHDTDRQAPRTSLDGLRIDRGVEEPRPRSWWLGALVAAAMVLATAAWWFLHSQAAEVRTVSAREVEAGGTRTLLNASGYVVARREATVSSKITAKVIEVLIQEGMKVEAGQVLARLDDVNLRAGLSVAEAQWGSAKAALAETRALLEKGEKELRRVTELAANKIASPAELDNAQADVNSLRARLERQQADIVVAEKATALQRQQVDDLVIRAPFTGIVTAKNAQPGEMISPMSAGGGFTRTGICTIVDMDSLEIEVDVNESYINRVVAGQPVEATLDAYPDWKIPSKVLAIIPTADRQKATVKVRVTFDRLDPRMLPQMGVKVAFGETGGKARAKSMVSIPKTAVQKQENRDVVMVVQNGRTERRAVTLGEAKSDQVQVLAGLAVGEKVVVQGPGKLAEGEKVREMGN